MMETTTFEISDYLDSPEVVANYLNEVLKNGDSQDLIVALGHVSNIEFYTNVSC